MKNKLPRKLKKKMFGTLSRRKKRDKAVMRFLQQHNTYMSNLIPKDIISEAFCENYKGLSNYILPFTALLRGLKK